MKVELTMTKVYHVKYLQVEANVRYWEDSKINGVADEEGNTTPCRNGKLWCPMIDVETGQITNWEQGKDATIHFKICDSGRYTLLDENNNEVTKLEGYVPTIMCPKNNGYGDYIIMDINVDGFIQEWDNSKIESDFNNDN